MTTKTKTIAIGYFVILWACFGVSKYLHFHQNSAAAALSIQYDCIAFQNITMQMEPYFTNTLWWTNMYGTNMIIRESTYNTALIGPTVKLVWDNANNTVLMWSTNLTDWNDIKIKWLGDTGTWFSYPQDKRFYKLRSATP